MFTLWKWVSDINMLHICLWWRVWRGGRIFIGGSDTGPGPGLFLGAVSMSKLMWPFKTQTCVSACGRTRAGEQYYKSRVSPETKSTLRLKPMYVCPCFTQRTDRNVIYCYHVAFKIYSWDLTINLTFTSFDWAAKVSGRLNCDQHDSLRDTRFFV